jgi:hypothetical protein
MGVGMTLLVTILGSLIAILLATELQSWIPWIERCLLRRAISKMPVELQARYSEEWSAHLADMPTPWARLIVALQLSSAGRAIASDSRQGDRRGRRTLEATVRRTFNLFAAASILLWVAPLLILTGLSIKLSSPGPLFIRTKRITARGEEWYVLKFRSTKLDGSQMSVGRLVHRLSIDELPQLLNVIRGDMTLIGGERSIARDMRSVIDALRPPLPRRGHSRDGASDEE